MARLSVEHYRANANMTPEHVRKTSRLRDMFKSRSSASPSTKESATKSLPGLNSLSPPTSPISPSLQPGFKKVGLFPSERESLLHATSELQNKGGNCVAEALKKQENDLVVVGPPLIADIDPGATIARRTDVMPTNIHKVNREDEANVIAEAFQDTLSKPQDEGHENFSKEESSKVRSPEAADISRLMHHTLLEQLTTPSHEFASATEDDNHRVFENHKVVDKDGDGYHLKQEETRDGTITRRGLFSAAGNIAASKPVTFVSNSEQTFRDQYNVHNDMDDEQWDHHGDEVLDSEQRISQDHGVSFTSMPASGKLPYKTTSGAPNHEMLAHGGENTSTADSNVHNESHIGDKDHVKAKPFDREEPLSHGLQKYVATKVAEALKERDRQQAKDTEKPSASPLLISFHMDMTIPKSPTASQMPPTVALRTRIVEGPKSLANITIKHPLAVIALQLIVVAYYVDLALRVFLYGPLSMFTSIFLDVLVLSAYVTWIARIGNVVTGSDLLLTPLEYIRDLLLEKTQEGVRFASRIVAHILMDTLPVLADEKIVEIEMK